MPVTPQDVVLIFCTVSGWKDGRLTQVTDARKIYHGEFIGETLQRHPDHDRRRHLRGAGSARCGASCRERFRQAGAGVAGRFPRQPVRALLCGGETTAHVTKRERRDEPRRAIRTRTSAVDCRGCGA